MVSVWGCITHEGLGPLVRILGKFTANNYCDVLENVGFSYPASGLFADNGMIFQHDNSPIHTSKRVQGLLQRHAVTVLIWPPQSPDFNIIENVWGTIKKSLARQSLHGLSADRLWTVVQAEWDRLWLNKSFVEVLYGSLPKRMKAVLNAGGDVTHY